MRRRGLEKHNTRWYGNARDTYTIRWLTLGHLRDLREGATGGVIWTSRWGITTKLQIAARKGLLLVPGRKRLPTVVHLTVLPN